MGQYSEALSFYEKDLEISQKALPLNHPDLITSYDNIAEIYCCMKEYSKALSTYECALSIFRNSFPSYHPIIQLFQEKIERIKSK